MLKKASYIIMFVIFIMVVMMAVLIEKRARNNNPENNQPVLDERFKTDRPDYNNAGIENIFQDEIGR